MGTFKGFLVAIVVFIAATQMIDALVTGTDSASVLIQTLGPLLLGIGAIFVVLKGFGSGK